VPVEVLPSQVKVWAPAVSALVRVATTPPFLSRMVIAAWLALRAGVQHPSGAAVGEPRRRAVGRDLHADEARRVRGRVPLGSVKTLGLPAI
jgi:hypothetical protein